MVGSVLGSSRHIGRIVLATACAGLLLAVGAPRAGALPAGWHYELVSPADTEGIDISGGEGASDGIHAWITTLAPLTGEQSTGNITTLEATRTATGWTVRDLADPSKPGDKWAVFAAVSEDASRSVVDVCDGTFLSCPGDVDYERVSPADGARTVMATFPRSVLGGSQPTLMGASADLSTVVLENDTGSGALPLVASDTHTQGHGLYASRDGQLTFIGVDAGGTALPCGAVLADDNNSNGSFGNGFEQSGISADGHTVDFESPDPDSGCPDPVDVYVRRDGHSVDISAPTNGNPDLGATFDGSSRDGNVVYFTTPSQLVAADTDSDPDIYAYDVPTATLTRITPDANASSVAVSPSGDYVYFQAANTIDGHGVPGQSNLFLYHAGVFTFVATTADVIRTGGAMNNRPSPITPDGTHLLFASSAELTGQPTGGQDQLFQYDATADHLTCVSCTTDGSTPTASADMSAAAPGTNVFARFQSDDGSRVVFTTRQSLVPQDVNGQPDSYLWDSGTLSLITTGTGDASVGLFDMSADGRTIFFTSTDRLVPGVTQDNGKFYVARQGLDFPAPQAAAPQCDGDVCQGSPTPPPAALLDGSSIPRRQHVAAKPSTRVTLAKVSAAALGSLARTGALTLTLRVTGPTTVSVRITGHTGKSWTVAGRASRTLRKAGKVRLTVHFVKRARAYLRAHGSLRIRIAVTGSGTSHRTLLVHDLIRL